MSSKKRQRHSNHSLSKSRLIDYLRCRRMLWMKVNESDTYEGEEDPVAAFRLEQGEQVGEIARSLFPKGKLIEGQKEGASLVDALAQTKEEVDKKRRRPLFEATFQHEGVLVRADLLIPTPGGQWKLIDTDRSKEQPWAKATSHY